MKAAQDIILKPIITEESMMGIMVKKYTFKVAKTANKIEIAKAVEEAFPNKGCKGKHNARKRPQAPSGLQRWLHSVMEEGYRNSYRGFKGN